MHVLYSFNPSLFPLLLPSPPSLTLLPPPSALPFLLAFPSPFPLPSFLHPYPLPKPLNLPSAQIPMKLIFSFFPVLPLKAHKSHRHFNLAIMMLSISSHNSNTLHQLRNHLHILTFINIFIMILTSISHNHNPSCIHYHNPPQSFTHNHPLNQLCHILITSSSSAS